MDQIGFSNHYQTFFILRATFQNNEDETLSTQHKKQILDHGNQRDTINNEINGVEIGTCGEISLFSRDN